MSVTNWNTIQNLLEKSWIEAQQLTLEDFTLNNIKHFYLSADPFISGLGIVTIITLWCYIASLITRNYSQVDKLWPILPVIYAWHFILQSYLATNTLVIRALIMAILVTIWGIRLTFNFWRKGGYTYEGEDYRWVWLKGFLHPIFFQILNITFIAIYQNILIYLFAIPPYLAIKMPHIPINGIDVLATTLFLLCLLGETVADQQMWNFQSEKYRRKNNNEPLTGEYSVGFLRTGLWKYSRHPNFFCEMSIWWAYYLFTVSATGQWINWSVTGTFLLTLLFQGSTPLTEYISKSKYSKYEEYQKTTSRLMFWPPSEHHPKQE
eukprot:gb/GECH01014729.1/.p1 GENE.gb/GECH01014729.1/~~gb/GECH01014729.1/.p1  ORF type:complete len:321 (+),score=20.73 gb/GECH01014729.1/:1-963(+)